jgi:hypothetical protein
MFLRTLVAAGVAAASLGVMAGPAAARDICNGVYELDGCEYCSSFPNITASPDYYCDWNYAGYRWVGCRAWVGAVCLTGTIQ